MFLDSPLPPPKKQSRKLTEDDYVFIPFEKAYFPREGVFDHYVDKYWLVHPEKGLAFYNPKNRNGNRSRKFGAPQCNDSKAIVYSVAKHAEWPHEIRQIPLVFVPIDMSEYDH